MLCRVAETVVDLAVRCSDYSYFPLLTVIFHIHIHIHIHTRMQVIVYGIGGLMSYMTVIGGTASDLLHSWGCSGDVCGVYSMTALLIAMVLLPPLSPPPPPPCYLLWL